MKRALYCLGVGLVGAIIAEGLGVPAGLLIGAMLATMIFSLADRLPGRAPRMFSEIGKVLLGTAVGATFSRATLMQLGQLLLGAVLSTLALVGTALGLAWLLSRWTKLSLATALFSLTPGGIQEMVAVCEECGADVALVAVLQFLRYVCVLMLVPMIVAWLSS